MRLQPGSSAREVHVLYCQAFSSATKSSSHSRVALVLHAFCVYFGFFLFFFVVVLFVF